jgi:hypothetical protein
VDRRLACRWESGRDRVVHVESFTSRAPSRLRSLYAGFARYEAASSAGQGMRTATLPACPRQGTPSPVMKARRARADNACAESFHPFRRPQPGGDDYVVAGILALEQFDDGVVVVARAFRGTTRRQHKPGRALRGNPSRRYRTRSAVDTMGPTRRFSYAGIVRVRCGDRRPALRLFGLSAQLFPVGLSRSSRRSVSSTRPQPSGRQGRKSHRGRVDRTAQRGPHGCQFGAGTPLTARRCVAERWAAGVVGRGASEMR